jgi:hypothetical protein
MPVLVVGGIFLRARDRQALSAWYLEHLGTGPGDAVGGTDDLDRTDGTEWDSPEIGRRLRRIHDSEGNPIELWEPAS